MSRSKKTHVVSKQPVNNVNTSRHQVPSIRNVGGNTPSINAGGSVVESPRLFEPSLASVEAVANRKGASKHVSRVRAATKAPAALLAAAKKPVKTSVLEDIIALNKSVGIDEAGARDLQIQALRKTRGSVEEALPLITSFTGLDFPTIQQVIPFEVKILRNYVGTKDLISMIGVTIASDKEDDRNLYKGTVASANLYGQASATSLAWSGRADPLSEYNEVIQSNATDGVKLVNLKKIISSGVASKIVDRYKDRKLTDSYKVTCIALELEVLEEQISRYKKDVEEAFNAYFPTIGAIVVMKGFVAHMKFPPYGEEIARVATEFNERAGAFLEQRNDIEKIQIQNYDKLTSAQKNPSIQKFKSEILSEAQFNEIFEGITLSGIQFEALREIESILINPESRSKPLVSFNMGEGKTFLIELVKKYAAEIEQARDRPEYGQVYLEDKIETVATLELQIEMHKGAIKSQTRGQAVTKEGTAVPLEVAKAQLKLLEDQLGKIGREVNQTRLNGLTIEIIDRANEAEKLRDLNAKRDLRNTFIFWDESRYGLQESSDIRLGSQLRSLKDKKANLVLVGATVNEIKLVEAVNRARDKGKTKQQIDKAEHDLEEFRKRKVRAINKISESDIEKETAAFAQNWAEIVKKNHRGGNKKSQHVFLDLKLELVRTVDLTVGLRKIITGDGAPEIAMVNFIRNGEYRCLIAKKGNPDQIINTKVGNRDYYKAILQDSSAISFAGQDRELTAAEINTIKLQPFVDNIAQIYGERYSIGGVYDKVDVLQTGVDSQILYASKAEKINLAEIGQAQSRNRNSKPLKGRIVIQGDWFPQVINANGLAEMALKNFEHRDLAEFVEDLDSKMTKYFHDGQSGRKCSEVLSDIDLSDQERVKIIGGDTVLMMQKFLLHIRNMESDVRHKFIRDVKLFIHYSSLLNVRLSEQGNPNQRAGVLIERLMLNYAPLLSGDYQYEFDEALLSQSSGVLNSGSEIHQALVPINTLKANEQFIHQALVPINTLKANEQFIDHFSRLTYSQKTEACLKRERDEAEAKAKEEKRTQKARDAEEKRKQGLALEELQRQQEEADKLEKYLNDLTQQAEELRIERIRLEEERFQLLQREVEDEMVSREVEVTESEITASLVAQLENVNKRIAEKRASEAGLVSQKESAVIEKLSVEQRLRKLQGVINVIRGRDELLAGIRNELQLLYNQSSEREKTLQDSEELMARMESDLEALKREGDEGQLELDGVIAASDKKAEQIQAIAQSIKSSNDQIKVLYSQKIECDARIGFFEEQIKTQNLENKSLEAELLTKKNLFDFLTAQLGGLTPQEAALREKLLRTKEEVKQLSEDQKGKQTKASELDSKGQALKSAIKKAKGEILGLKRKISEITEFLKSEGETKQGYENSVFGLSEEIRELESRIETETRLLGALSIEVTKKLSYQQDLQGKLTRAEEEQGKLPGEKDDLEDQIRILQIDRGKKISASDSVAKSAEEARIKSAELDGQLSLLESSLLEKAQALQSAREEEAELRRTLGDTKSQIGELESQIDSSRTLLEKLEEQVNANHTKISSITRGIERVAVEMDDIRQRALDEGDIEKRTALTAALLEKIREEIEEKQRELQNGEVEQGTSELYSEKLRELSESLEQSFVEAGLEQERVRQERELKRKLETDQLNEVFENRIKALTKEQSEKDQETQSRIEEIKQENNLLKKNLLKQESLIASEALLKKQMQEKEIEIAQLKETALQQEQSLRELEEKKSQWEKKAQGAQDGLRLKESLYEARESEKASLVNKNLLLISEIDRQGQEFEHNKKELRNKAEEAMVGSLMALLDLENMRSELKEVKAEKDKLASKIEQNKEAYDLVKERMKLECEELRNSLVQMQQQHQLEIQVLEEAITELHLREPEPDLELVISLQNQLAQKQSALLAQEEVLQFKIAENQALQERVGELTATKSTELEAPKKGPAKVNMELAHHALAEEVRVLNLNPTELRKERDKQHVSERRFNHVVDGSKYVNKVTHIVAPIDPSVLSIRNFSDGDDQRYYDIEFRNLTFRDYPKTAEELGIFNDAKLLRGNFRHCKFDSVDFSKIDPEIFKTIRFLSCEFHGTLKLPTGLAPLEHFKKCKFHSVDFREIDPETFKTINFASCEFDGITKLPNGFKLEEGKIERSEATEIPRPIMKSRPPTDPRSSFAARSPRANIHAKPATLLGSTGGGGR